MKSGKHYFNKISKFSSKMFLMILVCIIVPLFTASLYIRLNMEGFIQKQLSNQIIQNISKNERNISDALQEIAGLSNYFILNKQLRQGIASEATTTYENATYFNNVINNLGTYTVSEKTSIDDVKIILFDLYGRVYSNWGLNFNNYQFLLEQDWIQESIEQKGHIVWNMFSPAYIVEDMEKGEKYISLARSILKDGTTGKRVGTIVISIGQYQFRDLLLEYSNVGDIVYICIDNGEVLLTNDINNSIPQGEVAKIFRNFETNQGDYLQQNVANKEYLVNYYTIPKPWIFDNQQMRIIHFTDYQAVSSQSNFLSNQMNIFMGISLILVIFILFIATKMLVKPIEKLTDEMEVYAINNKVEGLDTERNDEIGHLNKAFCNMSDNINGLFLRLKEEQEIKEKYHFESLRAQLNPHFLFNTLTSIRWMAMIRGADNIVESIDALANMLRYSMSRDSKPVTLKEEIDNIKNYVYIQNYRYGNHCELIIEIPENMYHFGMIKFVLQPIVENAVIHGYDDKKEKVVIQITGAIENDKLMIQVKDNGVGVSSDVIDSFQMEKQSRYKKSKLTGIGLTNVDECIRITYGEEYGLTIEGSPNIGTIVTFKLPIIVEDKLDEKNNDS
jgi:two-component system sensor histidine kinase YesM